MHQSLSVFQFLLDSFFKLLTIPLTMAPVTLQMYLQDVSYPAVN